MAYEGLVAVTDVGPDGTVHGPSGVEEDADG